MRQIFLEEETFKQLERHIGIFGESPDVVINRALETLDGKRTCGAATIASITPERVIDARQLPELRQTKVLDATIGGQMVERPKWRPLLYKMVQLAFERVGCFEKLAELFEPCSTALLNGRKEDKGYKYLSAIDVSVQNRSSSVACQTIVTIAHRLDISLDIGFMWRPKQGAAYPGERARLRTGGAR